MDRRKRDREGSAAAAAGEGDQGGRTDSESTSFDDGSFRGALGTGAAMDFSSEKDDAGFRKNVAAAEERNVRAKVDDSPKTGSSAQSIDAGEAVARPARGSVRPSGGKDRHSKVQTSKGLRDRRVRLSVATAIQFYDVQDRLGYDQPSKAVEWLLKKAKAAIDDLPPLPAEGASGGAAHGHGAGAFSPPLSMKSGGPSQLAIPRFYPQGGIAGLSRSSSFKEMVEREEEQMEQEQQQQHSMLLEPSSVREGAGDAGGIRERVELRVKARERARERAKEKSTGSRDAGSPPHSPEQQQQQQQQQSLFPASIPHSIPFDSSSFSISGNFPSFTSLLQTPFQSVVPSPPPPSSGYSSHLFPGQQLSFQQALLQASSLEQQHQQHQSRQQFHQSSFSSLPPPSDMSFYSPSPAPGLFPAQLPAAAAGILPHPTNDPLFMPISASQFRPSPLLDDESSSTPSSASYLQGFLRPHHSFGVSSGASQLQFEQQPFPPSSGQHHHHHHFGSSLDRSVSGSGPRELGSGSGSSSSSRLAVSVAGPGSGPGSSPISYFHHLQSGSQQQQFPPGLLHGIGIGDAGADDDEDEDEMIGSHLNKDGRSSSPRARRPP